jgi:RimJ/RimL family protein N-acetyltransferase
LILPLIRNASKEVLEWASHQMGCSFTEPMCRGFGITDRHGALIGAAIWSSYQHKNVELSCVGAGAFRAGACRELARFAFDELECERISFTVRASDEYTLKVAMKFGWRVEGRKRRYFADCDAIILGMLRSECPFLR